MPKGDREFPGAAQCAADLAKLGVEAGYRAGLIAGLKEAADAIDTSLTRRSAAANIRARIAALETEDGKS